MKHRKSRGKAAGSRRQTVDRKRGWILEYYNYSITTVVYIETSRPARIARTVLERLYRLTFLCASVSITCNVFILSKNHPKSFLSLFAPSSLPFPSPSFRWAAIMPLQISGAADLSESVPRLGRKEQALRRSYE